ncbi:MAG: ABC transporter ATP-binding protein [Actinomycetes bacterium]
MTAVTVDQPDALDLTLSGTGAGPDSTWRTIMRGLQLSPELRDGLGGTLVLAVLSTTGRVVVPIAIQQTIDRGLSSGTARLGFVTVVSLLALCGMAIAAVTAYFMNVRLYVATETALANLRVRAFRHIHDLSVLHQATERRGSLVSRVTSDIDQLSEFTQWGGVQMVTSLGQVLVATILMLVYSWQLTLVVWACFVPLALSLKWFQGRLARIYIEVRKSVGEMLGAVAESVVGAPVIRAFSAEKRTAARLDRTIERYQHVETRAQVWGVAMFTSAEIVAGLATAGVVVVGVLLGVDGNLTVGTIVAFLFIITLFIGPVQLATEVLDHAQNAVAGWRRVIGVLDTPSDVADPGASGTPIPPGPIRVTFADVSYAYPTGPTVLADVDLEIEPRRRVAIVGETGSGKTTFAKLLTRLMDPVEGNVLLSGVRLDEVPFESLRTRVVMVPQDGHLFDATIAANVAYGRPGLGDADVEAAFGALDLGDWLAGLPRGVATEVGERGGALSVGERQLVALARAYVANPDLLVLDEATSAVDPATDVRIQRALEDVTAGRTSVTIAHRMSTATAADEVIVFDGGRVVQRGAHAELVAVPGTYANLYASWQTQRGFG